MFARKKPEAGKKRQHDLSQFGLMEIPDDFDPSAGYGDDADSDLEAELAAIAGGGKPKVKAKPKPQMVNMNDLDKMIAESLKDISDDEDDSDDNPDPDLLGELQNITSDGDEAELLNEEAGTSTEAEAPQLFLPTSTIDTISIIRARLEMYTQAEANAKAAGEAAKARRFNRGLKTLNDLFKQASAGKTINVDDIPPEVSVKPLVKPDEGSVADPEAASASTPTRVAPPPPPAKPPTPPATEVPEEPPAASEAPVNPLVGQMRARQQEYKMAALQSKRSGDTETALQFLKVVKQFDTVIKMCEDGQEVDLSDMPPPPAEFKEFLAKMQENAGGGSDPTPESTETSKPESEPPSTSAAAQGPPPAPTTILEALQQRLEKYKSVEEAAKAEGNASKARRFGRIVKQYEDAIKCHRAGRPVAFDELPVPPGFGPLPTSDTPSAAQQPAPSKPSPTSSTTPVSGSGSASSETNTPTATPTPAPKKPSVQKDDLTTRTSGNQQKNNLAEQQMKILLERQKEFKVAAIEAKKAGEIEQAKEYLKIFKGFDALLNAASSGLPVDLTTLPLPPSQRENLEASFAIVTTEDCDPEGDISEIGTRMEEILVMQLMMCKNTRDHYKAMGNIAGMNRFENLAVTVQKDLDLVRYSKRKNLSLPKFHYEQRSFNIVHCNTDLSDNELEIVVVRGLNYNVPNPKTVDTYVKVEFPLLNDESFKAKTNLVKDTDSPEYNQRYTVEIQRTNRQFQRIFKRHAVKFEVYSRGGFLRSDILIGTVNVKLQPLETKCDIHDTFDLMAGRKSVGGKLEIKLRVRNPILTKQMEHINEKWLVVDS